MKKQIATFLTLMLLAAAMTGCSMEKLDDWTDKAINAVGTRVSDAMEDVDVREVLSNVADKVEGFLESMPETSSALQDTVSSLTSSVKSDLSSSGRTTTDESSSPSVDGISGRVEEGVSYTAVEDVAAYLYTYGILPPNYITTADAQALGWDGQSDLWVVKEGASIGGDNYENLAGLLPPADGRSWKQCDIGYEGGTRGNERLCYSNDGLYYYSTDRFSSFTELNVSG